MKVEFLSGFEKDLANTISIIGAGVIRNKFTVPTRTADDPYKSQFTKTLAIIENDEAKGWAPEILAKKMVQIVECRKPKQRYVIASFEQKLAVVLKKILPAKIFGKNLLFHHLFYHRFII